MNTQLSDIVQKSSEESFPASDAHSFTPLTSIGTPAHEEMMEHNQVSIAWLNRQAEVDEELAPLILALWKLDIDTANSCQENKLGIAWIQFLTCMDAEHFLNIVAVYPDEDAAFEETLYGHIVGCRSINDWTYDTNVMNLGVDMEIVDDEVIETPIGPSDFVFSVSIRFPRSDIPLIQECLDEALANKV